MNLKMTSNALTLLMAAQIPAFMWGPPGIGKTELIDQIGDETKRRICDWRANLRDPVDAMGIPVPDMVNNITRYMRPNDLPFEGSDFPDDTILFIDEANTASQAMQVVAMQLVHERRVGPHRLKKDVYVVAAGNRQSDRAAAQRMPTSLANRFAHLDVEPDVDSFVEWANKREVSPMIVAFLRWRPALLHKMDGADMRAFPTPRSWAQVSKIADAPSAIRLSLITGLVGEGAAAEFEGFIRTYRSLPSLDLVIANPNSAPIPEDPSARFAISAGLARKANDKNFENAMTYMKRLPREFEVMFAVDVVKRDQGLSHTQVFVDWSMRNSDVIIG